MVEVDGKKVQVTKTRQEKRTRQVPVAVMDSDARGPMVDVFRTRSEKRKRKIPGGKVVKKVEIATKDLNVRTIDEKKVEPGKAMSLLAVKTPVLILPTGSLLNPEFKQIVKPETLVVEFVPSK